LEDEWPLFEEDEDEPSFFEEEGDLDEEEDEPSFLDEEEDLFEELSTLGLDEGSGTAGSGALCDSSWFRRSSKSAMLTRI